MLEVTHSLLWRVVDGLDDQIMDIRLRIVEAVYGPEPETEADRQRGCAREDLSRLFGLDQSPR